MLVRVRARIRRGVDSAFMRLAIASGLTLDSASVQSRSVAAWKKAGDGPDANTPAVFAMGA